MLYQHAFAEYARAVTLYYRLVVEDASEAAGRLFGKGDLLFLLARAYEAWGLADGASPAGLTAGRTARSLWKKLGRVSAPDGDAEAWARDARTWRDVGDKCAFAGLDHLAADLYAEALRRDPGRATRALWYRLAKAERLRGRPAAATAALRSALAVPRRRGSRSDGQLAAVLRAWESGDGDDLADIPVATLLARLPADVGAETEAATRISARN